MGFFDHVRELYSLETLDTRFIVSSATPPNQHTREHAQPQIKKSKGNDRLASDSGQPPKWNTFEFYVYYLVFLTAVPLMFKAVFDVSRETHPEYHKYAPLLSDGWIPGRKVDNSDAQYSSFRDNIPYMAIAVILQICCRKAYDYFTRADAYIKGPLSSGRSNSVTHGLPVEAAADARLEQRLSFDLVFALVFLTVLYGVSIVKILLMVYLNYALATKVPKKYVPYATWAFNVSILFANEFFHGYPFASLTSFLASSDSAHSSTSDSINGWGAWLDSYGGLVSRWEVLFKITILRMISFNLDYCWSLGARASSPIEVSLPVGHPILGRASTYWPKKKQLDPANLSERDRISVSAKPGDYSLRNYLSYTLYAPLYLAGPIVTFNDFISQQRFQAPSITRKRTILYGIRFLLILLCMEVVLHFIYAVAISKAQPAWEVYTPFQLSMLGYFNLHIIWLKLLIPWRFFRLWALVDGVDAPENMVRCMSNNYSTMAFWRGWHRSFNRWTIRYIYIPLGGSRTSGIWGKVRAVGNFLIVFTFVAIWHDINLRLLIWGWLIVLFVLPEIIASLLFPAAGWRDSPTAYRVLCGIGAVGNILAMMAANLVGFALGLDGLEGLVHGIIGGYSGLVFLAAACGALFVGVQVMFEIREHELRRGIKMKC